MAGHFVIIETLQLALLLMAAGFPAAPIQSFEELVALADKALYQAKGEGKNRVCGAS